MAGIGDAIFSLLSNDSTLTTALGDSGSTSGMEKIYPELAPQNETPPWVTYSVYASNTDYCAQGEAVKRHFTQIDVWSENPDTAATIAARIIEVMEMYNGTVAAHQIDNILIENDRTATELDLDPPLFGRQIEMQIRELI